MAGTSLARANNRQMPPNFALCLSLSLLLFFSPSLSICLALSHLSCSPRLRSHCGPDSLRGRHLHHFLSAPSATMSIQPLRVLNARSAQQSSNGSIKWQVKITEPELSSFNFDNGAKKLHVFSCTLVGDDPSYYLRGVFKNTNEKTVQDVGNKFKEGYMFLMSKVSFDTRQKKEYISGPIKHVVLMTPTHFEPIMAGSLTLAKQAVPASSFDAILEMTQVHDFKGVRCDAAGFVRTGPLRSRTVNTKQGAKTAADFEIVQMAAPGDQKQSVCVTAWGHYTDVLGGSKGHFVTLFELDLKLLAPGKFSIETGWSARVVPWAPLDTRMRAFAAEVMQDSAPPPNLLTSTWTPEGAAGMDTRGEQPLVTTSFLRECEAGESKNVTWQLNGGFLDLPTGPIHIADKSRIWIITMLRDFSGCVEVGLSEAAALALAGVATKKDFEEAHENGSLHFPRCNVRGSRGLRDPLKNEFRYTVTAGEAQDDVVPLTKEAENLYGQLDKIGRGAEGIVGTPLKELRDEPCVGLLAGTLPVAKALLLVKGKERSVMESLQGARKMSTLVECVFNTAEPSTDTTIYRVVAFCQESRVADFKFDKGQAMILATQKNKVNDHEFEIVAEAITIVQADYVPNVRNCLQMERQLALQMSSSSAQKQKLNWTDSPPEKRRKCKKIQGYPSDPSPTDAMARLGA